MKLEGNEKLIPVRIYMTGIEGSSRVRKKSDMLLAPRN